MREVPPPTAPYEFLLSLDQTIRPLLDALEIVQAAASALGRHLQVNRCAYADVESDLDTFNLTGDYNDGVPSAVGRYRFSEFGAECLRLMRLGQPYIVEDSETDPRSQSVLASYRHMQIRSVICVPLLKAGKFSAAMAVHQIRPRRWRQEEVDLVQLVASRCWESLERGRVARELRELNQNLQRQALVLAEELTRAERQFAQLVAGVTDAAIYMLDANGRVTSWNPGAERIKGYSAGEIIGRHFSEFYTKEDRAKGLPARSLSLVASAGKFEGEGWRVRKDGSRFWASVLIDPIYGPDRQLVGYAKVTRDMTERRLIQEQLNQAQKMEAIGQLTGGVAHDFNNLLTVILGNLDTVQRRSAAGDERSQRAIEHASRGAERAAALTHQLLAFARRQPLNPKPTGVNQLVTTLLELIRRTLPEGISVQSRLSAGVGQVSVDANQMESALLNLAVNARDAMEGQGTLSIETHQVDVNADEALRLGDLEPGLHAVICVTDTGAGMSSEVIARAFDPFFTTKPVGQGTGLGLSQVFGFVKQSGGTVKLLSEVGHGTTVKIYLPRVDAESTVRPERHRDAPRGASNETVLVVEDEEDVRSYSIECLEELGFSVLYAADGPSALRLIDAHPEIRLLFTDVGLPHMNGRELAEKVRLVRPELPVLFTTGYAQDAMFQQGQLDENAELLTKPFNRSQLAERIRQLLDA
ncbi:PAS domain S-box protein [Steroidobacter sp.]|uniref:PAS domain S-box protein n=1 Tax=Steroidobacter sp. TaxID=1978227 RepID=UPI001A4ED2A5|nr:PAS domain S-box protein [Steroidobacter sp.]MBL8268916.1 PAS domain S-box protein [Steroidobacter sp.]